MNEAHRLESLPGYELYREGMESISQGRYDTAPAQLLLLARTRLRRAGLGFDAPEQAEPPHHAFYRLLASKHPDTHNVYNAYLRRLDKFCRAVERERLQG